MAPTSSRQKQFDLPDLESARQSLPTTTRRMIAAADEIFGEAPGSDITFLHSHLALCSLPYARPVAGSHEYERSNGRAHLLVSAGKLLDPETGTWVQQELPYGPKSRIIMAHLCSEAIRTKSPEINTAESLCGFMNLLGITPRGGTRGSIAPFKDQLQRLIAARMVIGYVDREGAASQISAQPVKGARIWFPSEGQAQWDSMVRLDMDFFLSLQNHAVPLDPRAISALKHNAMALDMYFWLAHRLHRVKEPGGAFISWPLLHEQFGQGYARLVDFRRKFRRHLVEVIALYPGARIEDGNKGLRAFNSPPPIPKRMISVKKIPGSR